MARIVISRLLQAVPLVLGIVVVSFVLLELTPGDPIQALVGDYPVPDEYRARLTEEFQLDESPPRRFVAYVSNLAKGNLGHSFFNRQPVLDIILSRLPNTLVLAVPSIVLASIIGALMGAAAATTRRPSVDTSLTVGALVGFSIPNFWLGQMLILVFAVNLGWFPVYGMGGRGVEISWVLALHLTLPMLALATSEAGLFARITRASTLESLGEDYIVGARAKGLTRRRVNYRHALRNSLLPLTTVVGFRFGYALSGTILIESVFAWPGLGRLIVDSIARRDNAVIIGVLVVSGILVLLVNLATDLTYGLLDPRLRRRR